MAGHDMGWDGGDLSESERLAVWTLRRVLCGGTACGGRERFWGDATAMRQAAEAFRRFGTTVGGGKRDLAMGSPGALSVTRDERRLLRAIAAAQDDDGVGVDAALYKIALDREPRAYLADAVQALAAGLAAQGHWLQTRYVAARWPQPAFAEARA